jgi:hypothetical protein
VGVLLLDLTRPAAHVLSLVSHIVFDAASSRPGSHEGKSRRELT